MDGDVESTSRDQLLDQLVRDRLAGLVMAGELLEDVGSPHPVLHDLARGFDEVGLDAGAREAGELGAAQVSFGEGLAIGTSFAFGQLTLGSFLIVGFMVHNVTEGLGIAAPAADEGMTLSWPRLAALALDRGRARDRRRAGRGGFIANDVLAVLFFGAAAGAAFEVVVEVVRYILRRDPAGLRSGYAIGGFLAGIAVMYVTGLLAA